MLPKTVGPLGLLLAAVACSSHRAPASVDGTELRIIAPWAPWSETALVRAGSTIRPPTLARGFAVELPTGAHRAVRLTVNGGAMQIVPEGVRETSAQIVGNAAYYRSAQAGTDVVYVATAGTFEDLRIVRHSTATVSAAYEIRTDGGIADLRVRGDRVFAFDRDGNVALSTGSIFVADARGERRTADVRLVRGDSAWRLEISASTAGMQAPIVLDPSWSAVASLDYEHIDCRVVELPSGGAVVVSGKNTGLAKYEVYDPVANTWTSGNLLFSRLGAPAVGLTGGKVLVPGGFTYVGTTYDSSTEIIDTSAKTTTAAASMKTGRGYHTATKLKSGKVLVVAGEHSETPYLGLSTAELYDPATDTWVDAGALPTTRQGHVAVLLDSGKVLVAGGGGAISYKDAFIYEPITGSWTPVTSMKADHTNGAGILLPSGKVLVVGYSNTGSSEAELYDPTTDSWSTAGVTKANRSSFSAAITPAGKVLVMGGFVFGPGDVSTVEIFDPTTLTWSDGPSMLQKHSNTGAAWLSTGKLLVPAGSAGYATFAEVYDPAKTCTLSTECAVGEHCEAGLCKPKLTVGKACVGPADCVSAFCVDGVCCDKACVGPCEACSAMAKGAGADGTCGNVAADTDPRMHCALDPGYPVSCKADGACDGAGACRTFAKPSTPCAATTCSGGIVSGSLCDGSGTCKASASIACDPYTCNASATACRTSCASAADCVATAFCSGGVCIAKLGNGKACSAGSQCGSGNCVDGVCCNSSCGGPCEACTAALKGSGSDGACGNVAVDTDPRSRCAPDAGFPSNCKADGMCDGLGACRTLAKSGTACGDSTCADGKVSGKLCDGAGTCATGSSSTCGVYRCDSAGKACLTACASDMDCATGYVCGATKSCVPKGTEKKPDGDVCTSGDDCTSANCIDGVCCNVPCDGQCQACDVPGKVGTCSVIAGTPHGTRASCGDGVCAGKCDGTDSQRCVFPPAETACGTTCASGSVTARVCKSGACVDGTAASCNGLVCDGDHCANSCTDDLGCVGGYSCANGACVAAGPVEVVSGCGCTTVGSHGPPAAAAIAALAMLSFARRRRQKVH